MHIDWILPRQLAVGPTPLSDADLQALANHGIRTIITLTEIPICQLTNTTPERVTDLSLTALHRGFPDQTAPSSELASLIVTDVQNAIQTQQPVYLHCFGGIGRTGTVLQLILLEAGLSLTKAQALIRQRRPICLRLTPEQTEFIKAWDRLRRENQSTR